jgi:hypothetical protein
VARLCLEGQDQGERIEFGVERARVPHPLAGGGEDRLAHPIADIGDLHRVKTSIRANWSKGHRVVTLWVFLGGFTLRLTLRLTW